jgi:DUF2889 family protein
MPWREQMADIPFDGIYRRQIDLRSPDERTVVGWLEDESHHFGITLVHDGERITDVRAAAPRHPWTTCPGAAEPLRSLVGLPLTPRCAALGSVVDMRLQCTHLFDLASLAIAHAHARREHRRYHGTVAPASDPGAQSGRLRATLYCDGRQVLFWELDDDRIVAPSPYAGRTIYHGFRPWTDTLDVEEAEHALVLRRVAFVSNGRKIRIEHLRNAAELGQDAVCHSFRPGVREIAVPVPNSRRRYDDAEHRMLALARTMP